jgi:hypothetical protein
VIPNSQDTIDEKEKECTKNDAALSLIEIVNPPEVK